MLVYGKVKGFRRDEKASPCVADGRAPFVRSAQNPYAFLPGHCNLPTPYCRPGFLHFAAN